MKVVGIITEYNPFHHGHHYQIQAARQATQADIIVVLMSGNVVQRGEFAILDKWQRAQLAMHYGADLVLELPLLASLQSADYFAKTGVELLAAVGCDTLVFGTETATQADLDVYVTWLGKNDAALQKQLQNYLPQGFSYAAAMQLAIDDLRSNDEGDTLKELSFNPTSPNHLLGIQYVKANQSLEKAMEIVTIPRLTSEDELTSTIEFDSQQVNIKSGSQIRQLWWQNQLSEENVPLATYEALNSQASVQWADYWPLLKYRLTCHRPESLRLIFGVKEGFEHLLLQKIDQATDFTAFRQSLISKRWTQSSVQRVLLAVLLDIHTEEWETYRHSIEEHPLVRVLAYRTSGRNLLKLLKQNPALEMFSNYTQKHQKRYEMVLRADRVFALNPRVELVEQNYSAYPIQGDY